MNRRMGFKGPTNEKDRDYSDYNIQPTQASASAPDSASPVQEAVPKQDQPPPDDLRSDWFSKSLVSGTM